MMDQRTTCGRPLASIEKRLLDDLTRMTGCTAPNASLARQPGVVHHLSISAWVIRPLNVMVTSACDGRYGPDRRLDAQDRWLPERLRLRPHSEPACSIGTRRDTSRRCGGLATVPSASVLLQVDARERPEHLTTAGDSEGGLLRLAVIGHDGPVDDLLAVYWTPSTSVSWRVSPGRRGARPLASLARRLGVVHLLPRTTRASHG